MRRRVLDNISKIASGLGLRGRNGQSRHYRILAAQVEKRTCELNAINARLQNEINERKKIEQALRETQQDTRNALEDLRHQKYALDQHAIVGVYDTQGNICYANDQFCSVSGYSREELVGRHHRILDSGVHGKRFFREMYRTIGTGSVWHGEVCKRTKGGRLYWLSTTIVPYLDAQGKPIEYISMHTDITARKQAEEQLRVAAVAFETNEAIVITDADVNIIKINRAFTEITGYSEQDVLGKNPRIMSSGRHEPAFFTGMWQHLSVYGTWSGDIWDKRKNGEIYPKRLTITAVKDSSGKVSEYVAIFTDITDMKRFEEEMRNQAFQDPLTQLPNRRLFSDRLKAALACSVRNESFGAVLFIDLDRFKKLNDTLGHDYGDLMLVEVARRIQNTVREVDTVARLGGDEFVVLIEGLGMDEDEASHNLRVVAEKIREVLAMPYQLKDQLYESSPSIGVKQFKGNAESVEELIKRADIAMYQAKKAGRDTVKFFNTEMLFPLQSQHATAMTFEI